MIKESVRDEGFAAGIEAAAKECDEWGDVSAEICADRIRNLKPEPRSAEHTAEPSAQELERFEAWREANQADDWAAVLGSNTTLDHMAEVAFFAGQAALATAPSPRIEAEPVAVVMCCEEDDLYLVRLHSSYSRLTMNQPLFAVPPDRTPDARSTSDAAVVLPDPDEGWHSYTPGQVRAIVIADRATRSTDSSAEASDAARLDWITRQLSGKSLRDIGVVWSAWSESAARVAIDAAMNAKLTTAPHTADETAGEIRARLAREEFYKKKDETRVDGGAT